MQAISNLFFKPSGALVETVSVEEPRTDWMKVAVNGSAALISSLGIFAISVATTYSTALLLSAFTGIVIPGSVLWLLYPSTIFATYGIDKYAKTFFEKALGISTEQLEKEEPIESDSKKALGYLALGVITSLALWSLATVSAVFIAGMTMRLAYGAGSGGHLGRLFYLVIVAPLAGSFFSMPAIHQIAGPYFRKAKALSEN